MARQLDSFPASSASRYPWDEWLDGRVWELFRGEDFSAKVPTLISNARAQARRRGGLVRSRLRDDAGRESIIIQFSRNAV
jgi:hypothetical protein